MPPYAKHSPFRDAVVWLDDVERAIVAGQLTEDAVDHLCPEGRSDVVLLATLRVEARNDLRGTDGNLTPTAARLLNHYTTIISLDRELSAVERARAENHRDDPRVADALDQPSGIGFAEHIAAGPAAVDGWRVARQGENVTAAAIISAAVDARRAGLLSPLPRALLEELHLLYLGRRRHDPHRPSFSEGLLWTLKAVRGATGYLTAEADDRYSPFDYLVDHVQATSALTTIPTDAWSILHHHAETAGHLDSLATGAFRAGHLTVAEAAIRKLADAGLPRAVSNLGVLLKHTGRAEQAERWYRQAVGTGHADAMYNLGNLLAETGRAEEGERWYRQAVATGHIPAMARLCLLLRDSGRIEEAMEWRRRFENAQGGVG